VYGRKNASIIRLKYVQCELYLWKRSACLEERSPTFRKVNERQRERAASGVPRLDSVDNLSTLPKSIIGALLEASGFESTNEPIPINSLTVERLSRCRERPSGTQPESSHEGLQLLKGMNLAVKSDFTLFISDRRDSALVELQPVGIELGAHVEFLDELAQRPATKRVPNTNSIPTHAKLNPPHVKELQA
jgi:hypothetical protein